MTVKYPIWINKIEGSAQTPEEMNGIVEVLQNHAETLSLHDVRILAAASGIYTDTLIPSSEVPTEVGDKVFLVTQPGTYTNFGNVVLPENNFGFIFKNGNSFSIQSVEMPMQDLTVIENKLNNLTTNSRNLFDKNSPITGYYIHTGTGTLSDSANSAVSAKIPVSDSKMYYLSGKNCGTTEVVFYDINGGLKKPIDSETGVEFDTFTLPYENGKVKPPVGAVSFQMTIKFIGVGTFDNIQFEEGSVQTSYVNYGELINPILLNYVVNNEEFDSYKSEVGDDLKLLEILNSDQQYLRDNYGESTTNPQYFKSVNSTNINSPIVEIVSDTDSPFHSVLPYKRKFSYNKIDSPGTVFSNDKITIGLTRPSKISFSHWLKESELRAFYTKNREVYFGLFSYLYDVIDLVNNIGKIQTVSSTTGPAEYSSAKLNVQVARRKNGYVQIVEEFTNIVWKETFKGTTIDYYFIFNGFVDKLKTIGLNVYNFTLLINQTINSNVLIYGDPLGGYTQNPTSISSVSKQVVLVDKKVDSINNELFKTNVCRVQIIGEELYFASPFSEDKELVKKFNIKRQGLFSSNPNVNIVNTSLISKSGALHGGVVVKDSGDDICPANLNDSYIGGNHGWSHAINLALNSHGKTFADIGSRWKDANNVIFTILSIVDADNIWVCSDNQSVNDYDYSFRSPIGNLIYMSNGVNQSVLSNYNPSQIGNLYNTMVSNKIEVLVNGVTPYPNDGSIVNCEYVDINEDYDIFDLPSTLQKLTANRPTNGYLENVQLNTLGADKLINHNITYRLLANGTTLIFHNFLNYKKVNFNFHGFMQSGAITGKLYMPKSLPISDGAKMWDFRKSEVWNPYPKVALYFTPNYWEVPNNPPDRMINYDSKVNLHLGYLADRGIGKLRKYDAQNWLKKAIFLNTTGKLYPFGACKESVIEANTSLSCVAFRHFSNPAKNPIGRLNYTWFDLNGKIHIYLDYNASILDTIKIPENWRGKKITISEKSSNVNVLSAVATNEIKVNAVIDGVNSYGYCVFTLE